MTETKRQKELRKPTVSFVQLPHLGDLIRPDGELQFAVYDRHLEKVTEVEEFEVGKKFAIPPREHEVANIMLLPDGVKEYGTEKELTNEIRGFVSSYFETSEVLVNMIAYYIMFTWLYDCFRTVPYLHALGDYGTGKSRLLDICQELCYRPIPMGGMTSSVIFRTLDLFHPTLIVDEADYKYQSETREDLMRVLNNGYRKGRRIFRSEKKAKGGWVVRSFDPFGPKILATRRDFPDPALESRCLTIDTEGRTRKKIPIILPGVFYEWAQSLRNKLLAFRFSHWQEIEVDNDLEIEGIPARLNEILLPLLMVFKSKRARDEIVAFGKEYSKTIKTQRSSELPAEVLVAILESWKIVGEDLLGGNFIPYDTIVGTFNADRRQERKDYFLSSTKLGYINKADLKFERRRSNTGMEIIFDEGRAEKLVERYGLNWGELAGKTEEKEGA